MADKPQRPSLLDVGSSQYQEVKLSKELDWFRLRIERFVSGGIYLIAGQPGIGKSTLGIQLALDLGRAGEPSLFILTEQSKEDLKLRAKRMSSAWSAKDQDKALSNIIPEDSLYDVEHLPTFISQHVLSKSGTYSDCKLVILDSIQGQGLSSASTTKYKKLYEAAKLCKANGITLILIAHVTKKGDIAGPKDLEHNVDCVVVMRKAMAFRPLFVPKNRFGPAVLKPVPLEIDKVTTALRMSPHSEVVSSVAKTFIGGDDGLAEAQAAVSLPSYGFRGKITAPGLPQREIEQLTSCISQVPDLDIEDLDYRIHCRLPGSRPYVSTMGLPVCMALISSYIQRDIPAHHVYVGEIDLLRKVREVPEDTVLGLWQAIEEGRISTPVRVFLPKESAAAVSGSIKGATVVPCATLEDAVFNTWPELKK